MGHVVQMQDTTHAMRECDYARMKSVGLKYFMKH